MVAAGVKAGKVAQMAGMEVAVDGGGAKGATVVTVD